MRIILKTIYKHITISSECLARAEARLCVWVGVDVGGGEVGGWVGVTRLFQITRNGTHVRPANAKISTL